MLPKDSEQRRQDAKRDKQSRLDPHLAEKSQKESIIIPYTDNLFRNATIEWLVSTDQVMEHHLLHYTLPHLRTNPSQFKHLSTQPFKI